MTNDIEQAFKTLLNADKKELAEHYRKLNEQEFKDSSAVHTESDLKAWVAQDTIKTILGHIHGVPAKLCTKLDNPSGQENKQG